MSIQNICTVFKRKQIDNMDIPFQTPGGSTGHFLKCQVLPQRQNCATVVDLLRHCLKTRSQQLSQSFSCGERITIKQIMFVVIHSAGGEGRGHYWP